MRTTIAQMLAIFLIVSAAISFCMGLTNNAIVWNQTVLPYAHPKLPNEYLDHGRNPPKYAMGFGPLWQYNDGEHLFRSHHRQGWEWCRNKFYESTTQIESPYPIVDGSLSETEWTLDHIEFASAQGFDQCNLQIQELVDAHGFATARNRIGYSNVWHILPPIAMCACGIWLLTYLHRTSKRTSDLDLTRASR